MTPVFISVIVIFAPATPHPLSAVTVPRSVALTACPMTGGENTSGDIASNTAMPIRHGLNRPAIAGAANFLASIARDLFQLCIQGENERISFFMTSPHSIRKDSSPGSNKTNECLELVPHPNRAETTCQVRIFVKRIPCIGFLASCHAADTLACSLLTAPIPVLLC